MKTLTPQILAMYLGCECQILIDYETESQWVCAKLKGITDTHVIVRPRDINGNEWDADEYVSSLDRIKILLRPLSSMTADEEKEMIATQDDVKLEGYPEILLKADSGETFLYMLRKGFDLFNLIENGLAIDSTQTIKTP